MYLICVQESTHTVLNLENVVVDCVQGVDKVVAGHDASGIDSAKVEASRRLELDRLETKRYRERVLRRGRKRTREIRRNHVKVGGIRLLLPNVNTVNLEKNGVRVVV